MKPQHHRMLPAAIAAAILASCSVAYPADVGQEVAQIIAKIDKGEPVWRESLALEKLGPEAGPAILKALPEAKPNARLACARALCVIGDTKSGIDALCKIIDQQPDDPAAEMAATLLGQFGQMRAEAAISDLLDRVKNVRVKIVLARSLHSAATEEAALQKASSTLHELFKSSDVAVREEAALALAEIGEVDGDVQTVLSVMETEPTVRGALARNLLRMNRLQTEVNGKFAASDGLRDPLLNEIRRKAQMYHVDEPATLEELRDGAAKGIADALDPFSDYLSEKELKKFRESLSGEYAGIGAHVGYPGFSGADIGDRVFTLLKPIYTAPAYRAGLRAYDQILEIEGKPTKGRDTEELASELRGKVNTQVTVTIRRTGWKEDRKFTITREAISLPTVQSRMLPGDIGYVRLMTFGDKSSKEFSEALTALEKQGAKAVIVDLRNNLGGLLNAARDIADLFLKDDKLIVSSRGRNPAMAPLEELRTQDAAEHPDYPLVVLVNERSASASEIVAGALQDHKRAIIVGTRTYGKGSVQKVLPLETSGNRSALKLTVAKYYLPSGRSIQRHPPAERGGVMPDIEIFQDQLFEPEQLRDFDLLRTTEALDRYWDAHREADRKKLEGLADFDGNKNENYPGFEEWIASLKGRFEKDVARRALRAWLRTRLADERAQEFTVDFENDTQLQRATMELAKRLGVDGEKIEEYRGLMAKFKLNGDK